MVKDAKLGVMSVTDSRRNGSRVPGSESGGGGVESGNSKEKLRNARQFGGGARLAGRQGG